MGGVEIGNTIDGTVARVKWTASVWVFVLPLLAAPYAFYMMYDRFSGWDDEGAFLIAVNEVMKGHKLFDEVFTGHGPVYFVWQWTVLTLFHLPVSHDTARALSLISWLVAAAAATWALWRLTASRAVSIFGALLLLKIMSTTTGEPGHPQDVVTLADAALLICLPFFERGGLGVAVASGIALGAMVGTKINIGVYYALAFTILGARSLGEAGSKEPAYFRQWARFFMWAMALALPIVLMWPHVNERWAQALIAIVTAGIASAIFVDASVEQDPLTRRQFVIIAGSAFATLALALLPFLVTGSTIGAWIYSAILQNVQLGNQYYYPIEVSRRLAIPAFVLLCGVLIPPGRRRNYPMVFAVVRVVLALAMAVAAFEEWLVWIYTVMPAAIWLLMPDQQHVAGSRPARVALAWLAALGVLYIYPAAGNQAYFACLALVFTAAVLLADGLRTIERSTEAGRLVARAVRPTLVALALAGVLALTIQERSEYWRGIPLNLPGSSIIRLPRDQAEALQQVSRTVVERCRSFVSMPGLFSFHFWTGLEPVTSMNADDWMARVPSPLQARIVSEAREHDCDCVIYNPYWVSFWQRGQNLAESPLANYIQSEFSETWEHDGYRLLQRRR